MQQQGMEAFAFRVDRERQKLQRQMPSARGRVDPNDPKERAGDGRPKERVNLDSPDDQAGNGHLKTRSTKVPTKSGHGFSVETVNKDISSRDKFSLASKVASIGTDDKLDSEATGAALRTPRGPAAAWDGPAAGMKTLSRQHIGPQG